MANVTASASNNANLCNNQTRRRTGQSLNANWKRDVRQPLKETDLIFEHSLLSIPVITTFDAAEFATYLMYRTDFMSLRLDMNRQPNWPSTGQRRLGDHLQVLCEAQHRLVSG